MCSVFHHVLAATLSNTSSLETHYKAPRDPDSARHKTKLAEAKAKIGGKKPDSRGFNYSTSQ